MSITPEDINNLIEGYWTPTRQARALYYQGLLKSGFWLSLVEGEPAAYKWVEEELKKYDDKQP